jgi:hypothetical protein
MVRSFTPENARVAKRGIERRISHFVRNEQSSSPAGAALVGMLKSGKVAADTRVDKIEKFL